MFQFLDTINSTRWCGQAPRVKLQILLRLWVSLDNKILKVPVSEMGSVEEHFLTFAKMITVLSQEVSSSIISISVHTLLLCIILRNSY